MDEKKLQKRYAQSLFDLSKQQDILNTIFNDVTYIYNICKENRELEIVLKNPIIKPLKKKEILLALFEKDCNVLTIKFLVLIATKRREIYLKGICEEFFEIYNVYNNIKIAKLIVANDISKDLANAISQKLEQEYNCKIQLEIEQNKNLIGGFVVEIEGKQYDASFIRKLNDLKKKITS